MKKHILLTVLFLFVTAIGFSLVEERPPTDNIKIEFSIDQPDIDLLFEVTSQGISIENGVLTHLSITEVEIMPPGNLVNDYSNLNETNFSYAVPIERLLYSYEINGPAFKSEVPCKFEIKKGGPVIYSISGSNKLETLMCNYTLEEPYHQIGGTHGNAQKNFKTVFSLTKDFDYSMNKLLVKSCQNSYLYLNENSLANLVPNMNHGLVGIRGHDTSNKS